MAHLSTGLVITPKLPVLARVGCLTPLNREEEEEAQYLYDLAGKTIPLLLCLSALLRHVIMGSEEKSKLTMPQHRNKDISNDQV